MNFIPVEYLIGNYNNRKVQDKDACFTREILIGNIQRPVNE